MCSVAFHHAPNPTSGTKTQRLGPLLKPTMDYLGLKTGQRGVSEGRESLSQKGDLSPLQRPFRNKINVFAELRALSPDCAQARGLMGGRNWPEVRPRCFHQYRQQVGA